MAARAHAHRRRARPRHDPARHDQRLLQHAAPGRSSSGPVYVATPSLLQALRDQDIGDRSRGRHPHHAARTVQPFQNAAHLLLTLPAQVQVVPGNGSSSSGPGGGPPGGHGQETFPCPKNGCLANPLIQEISALPSGTSAPNTVITEHAVHELHLQVTTSGWLIQTPSPPTASQITNARLTAAAAGLTVETKSSAPTSAEIINWATVFGILLALGILATSVGLIRSETASDLRTWPLPGRAVRPAAPSPPPPRRPRPARRRARYRSRLHRRYCLFQRQFARRPVIPQQRPGEEPPDHPHRHAAHRSRRRLAVRGPRASRHRSPADRVNRYRDA